MYNFRYHLVTIVSIFAALALGLLLGVAVTGSDLVRDASSNLAESLTEQFDELNATNQSLSDQLQLEQMLSDELMIGWQTDRLRGRTIAILTRTPRAEDSLAAELGRLVSRSGGVPITIRVSPEQGIMPEDDSSMEALRQIVPEIEGEDYETTLARALVEEWSYTVHGAVFPIEEALKGTLEANYSLTSWLLEKKRIEVTVSYKPLLDALSPANSPGSAASTPYATQRSAYELADEQQLPYGVNGVIDTAVIPAADGTHFSADSLAVQIALWFDQKGHAGELSYQYFAVNPTVIEDVARKSTTTGDEDGSTAGADATDGEGADAAGAGTDADSADGGTDGGAGAGNPLVAGRRSVDANYYALLVQQGDHIEALFAVAQDTGLACELSPLDRVGYYSVIALLSGADRGIYGIERRGVSSLPQIPLDAQGNAPFPIPSLPDPSTLGTPEGSGGSADPETQTTTE